MEGYQDDAAEFVVEDVEQIVRVAIMNTLNEHTTILSLTNESGN
jgi:hypothetical protein